MCAGKRHHGRGGELVTQSRREDRGHRDGGLPDREYVDARGIGNGDIECARNQPRGIHRLDGGTVDALQFASNSFAISGHATQLPCLRGLSIGHLAGWVRVRDKKPLPREARGRGKKRRREKNYITKRAGEASSAPACA